jgi:glutaredoxin
MDSKVYGTVNDMWTQRAVDVLERRGIACVMIDLDAREHAGERERLIGETRRYQTPYVYLDGVFIGSYAELDERDRLGQLAAPQPGRTPIVVAERQQEFVPPALVTDKA